MESSPNRFIDSEDMSVDDCDLKKLMEDCDKWSLKNDLQLLSHLKQMSNSLLEKTENANQSINNLVFDAKIHFVKVDNVINEFQMLANSQFVENRVYDEEVEDIITSSSNQQIDETVGNKSKDEEILNKIKAALNIGLDFMNQRFECVSNKVSQNDSDDENDQILEGLISNSSRDEYSQRLLPYIIGSDDFIKDNYVGLNFVEESPVIDLSKTRLDNDFSVKSFDSYESVTSEVRTPVPIVNNILDNIDDSEEESNDLFGTVPKIPETNKKSVSSDGSDSDSDPFVSENKELTKPEVVKSNEWKPSVPSFQDELSAAISAKNPNKTLFAAEEVKEQEDKPKPKSVIVNESQTKISLTPSFESESSDESDSIFNVNKTKPENRNKSNNFSNLFGEETTDDLIFDKPVKIQTNTEPSKKVDKILPQNSKIQKIPVKSKGLFDDDDEDEDDLFGAISKNKTTNKTKKHISSELQNEVETKTKGFIENNLDNKPNVSKTKSLFSDDEEEDDLFSGLSSKSIQNSSQNSDVFEPVVNKSVDPIVNKPKPNDIFIGELSSALKKKKLFQSDDEESDSNTDSDFNVKTQNQNEIISEIKIEPQINSIISKYKEIDSLFSEDNGISDNASKLKTETSIVTPIDSNPTNNEFYSEEPTLTLSNDGLKHRALLGSKRNRRPPTKKVLKMSPITDLYQTSEQSPEVEPKVEPKPPPVAAIRTVKTSNSEMLSESSKQIDDYFKSDILLDNTVKSVASLVKSPSTEEDDIFPTQTNVSKNQNMSKIFEKSDNLSNSLFNDSEDNEEPIFSSKSKQMDVSKKFDDKKGIFDTSDSDDDNFFSDKSSNVISNIIKPSNSELFNDVSSTDSSLSNKSDLKVDSKPAISLFSDSDDDDDLFAAVNRNKSVDKKPEKQTISVDETHSKPKQQTNETKNQKLKKNNSLFSDDDDEDNTDLFDKKDIKTITKSKVKPIFDLEEDDDDEDIFAPKISKTSATKSSILPKTQKEIQSSDLFDDPLFASRS